MNDTADPLTVALTGRLLMHVLLVAVLTWPIAMGILGLYTRAVRRSMRSRAATAASPAGSAPDAHAASLPAGAPAIPLREHTDAEASELARTRFTRLLMGPWRIAAVYAAGGAGAAAVITSALLSAGGLEFLPLRFLMLFLIFAWPVVLTAGLVAAATRGLKAATVLAYVAALLGLASLLLAKSPDLRWSQVFLLWAIYNLPASLLLLACLARPVRAVGPLILTFLFTALVGIDVTLSIAASDDRYLRFVVSVADAFGFGAVGSLWLLMAVGLIVFGIAGWLTLGWISRRYRAKRISDESVTVDAIWLLFTVMYSVGLVFEHVAWALAGVAAFATYKAIVRGGFALLRRHDRRGTSPRLLLLRSFSIGKDSERLFEALEKHWRRLGSIQLIAGVDLARRSVEPHEFLDFVSGKLARRFIDGPEALARRLRETDTLPDRDLRFRVNEFFCYEDTWRSVLSRLVEKSDLVFMDLRGFSRSNTGCIFEIRELALLAPLDRVVFIVDERTDEPLLAHTLTQATERRPLAADSSGDARIFRLHALSARELRRLLFAVSAASAPKPWDHVDGQFVGH